MRPFCRTCLQPINEDSGAQADDEPIEFTHKLMICMPEIDLFAVSDAKICNVCNTALNTAYNFKMQCRDVEQKITNYLREHGAVDLKKIVFEKSDLGSLKNEFDLNEVFIKQEEIILDEEDDFQESVVNSNSATKLKGKYQCYECEFDSNSPSKWKTHCKTHAAGNPYKCLICGFQTIDKSCFTRHHKTHSMEKIYKCSRCDYKTIEQRTLDKHLQKHQQKSYKCQRCGFSTTNNKQFVQHQRIHVGEKSYVCTMCMFSCARKSTLNEHVLIHGDLKAYTCVLCEYKTNVKRNLRSHLLTHARKL